ncbi:MAG: TIGR00730 family Rossman fold protein [Paludibacteraceae bacterium]|nr:TIGR00730 family Rossman fold protein [Paludibacteraceae bacterium]
MKICVYCSAKDSIAEEYKQLGRDLGKWIAGEGHELVFGGATGGLMTEVSKTVIEAGGRVTGVVPHRILASGRRSPWCTETIEVDNMSSRKQQMRQLADCFVCLPGSYGTLDEMFDVIASGTVGEHRKPIFILNYQDFYKPLLELTALMKERRFIPEEENYKPIYADSLEQIETLISTYK